MIQAIQDHFHHTNCPMEPLLKEERQARILSALRESRKVTVAELSQRFRASEVTIRRDLAELAASGLVIRAHRGALAAAPAPAEPPVMHRMAAAQSAKERIAQLAAGLVQAGDTLFLGSGSTTAIFAHCLAGRPHLTVVTNAINIALDLAIRDEQMPVIVIGGALRPQELSLLGHITEAALREVRVNRAVMGAQALSIRGGWTTDHMPEVATTRRILEMAPELIVLADSSKLGLTAPALVAPLQRITTLVTDDCADPRFLQEARACGINVLVAETGQPCLKTPLASPAETGAGEPPAAERQP
jgi:DeoR/GlpR family transcriptional regulator of sugar metabolism